MACTLLLWCRKVIALCTKRLTSDEMAVHNGNRLWSHKSEKNRGKEARCCRVIALCTKRLTNDETGMHYGNLLRSQKKTRNKGKETSE